MKTLGGAGLTGLAGGLAAIPVLTEAGAPRSETSMTAHTATSADVPKPPREFRAVWIATVDNIDWPSKPGLPVEEQKAELTAMFDRAAELNLNAVIFQVRPAADALYESEYEPWSEYLTGKQGKAPQPFYDPLALAVQEAHRRGIELHAWFNPFRVRHTSAKSPPAPNHINETHPELVVRYGKQLWLDPGQAAARKYSIRVMHDVVRRYDIDGVHIDDYFYPYPITNSVGQTVPFPDDASWAKAQQRGFSGSRADWRRQNIDRFIHHLYHSVKRKKRWVKFGISPFAIWRSGHPPQFQGFASYDKLYADTRKWLRNGWLDYLSPELYWRIADNRLSYPILLDWWVKQNTQARHIWPGNFTNRVGGNGENAWPAGEIIGQIYVTRGQSGATGNVHFSMKSLMKDPDNLVEQLKQGPYPKPALVPASPWLDDNPPARPSAAVVTGRKGGRGLSVAIAPGDDQVVRQWVIRIWDGTHWIIDLLPGTQRIYRLKQTNPPALVKAVVVSAVDRAGNEGPMAEVSVPVS
jgi:uncharacterized lipoprotein YddW (UPF0748 family)